MPGTTQHRGARVTPPTRASGWSPRGAVVLAAVAAAAVTIAAVAVTRQPVPAGLPSPGPLVDVGGPALRAALDLAAAGTVGWLLAAAFLVPARAQSAEPDATARLWRGVQVLAWSWCALALLAGVVAAAELAGASPVRLARTAVLDDAWLASARASALTTSAALVAGVALLARWYPGPRVARGCLVVSVGALVPALLTSHAAHAGSSGALADASLLVHAPLAGAWVGGLLALVVALRRWPAALREAVPRFSRLAGVVAPLVAVLGVVAVLTRVGGLPDLAGTAYGRLALAKAAVLVVLLMVGGVHRVRTVPAARDGRPGGLLRLAAVECVVMGVALGLAAALAGSPPPAG